KNRMYFWGESASPYFYCTALFLWLHGRESEAVSIALTMIHAITKLNLPEAPGIGVPDPYYSFTQVFSHAQLGQQVFGAKQTFKTQSYTLKLWVDFVARRGWKRALSLVWYDITYIRSEEFVPSTQTDSYRWRLEDGELISSEFGHPQSWAQLVASA